jgi:AraC-like DNA-binding protein
MLDAILPARSDPLSALDFEDLLTALGSYRFAVEASTEASEGEPFRWWDDTVSGPGIVVSRRVCTADWTMTLDTAEEALLVIVPLAGGRLEAEIGEQTTAVAPGAALIASAPSLRSIRFRSAPQLSYVELVFDSTTVGRVLASVFKRAFLGELQLAPKIDLSAGFGVSLGCLAEALVAGMLDDKCLERSPKSAMLLVEATLRMILENVPHRLSAWLDLGGLADAPHYIRLAANYMHANMHRPITVNDIARASGTSLRSLQSGFREHLEVAPMAYLRRMRLEAAHRELSAPQNPQPISAVAMKWGFSHLGRFSAEYRALYGVYPVDTVARTRHRR